MYFRGITILCFFLAGVFLSPSVEGQKRYKPGKSKYKRGRRPTGGGFKEYWFFGIGINALNYYGDLAPAANAGSTDISFTRPGFGFTFGHRFTQAAIRGTFNIGRLKGDDITAERDKDNEPRYLRNLSFRNDIKEFILGINFFLFEEDGAQSFRHPFNAYIFLGGGVFHHAPQGKVPLEDYQLGDNEVLAQNGEWVYLRRLGTEGQYIDGVGQEKPYKAFEFNIPIEVGGEVSLLNTPIDLHLTFGYRFVFTDYLDDVSTNFVPLHLFETQGNYNSPEQARLARIFADRSAENSGVWENVNRGDFNKAQVNYEGSLFYSNPDVAGYAGPDTPVKRGSPLSKDMYFVTQIKMTYALRGKKAKGGKYRGR